MPSHFRPLILILMLCAWDSPGLAQPADAPNAELERVEKTLQALTELKAKLAASEAEVDRLIAELSEQKGAVQTKKPAAAFGGVLESGASGAEGSKPKAMRCAAITGKGERCTRAAGAGSRYCKQHVLGHSR